MVVAVTALVMATTGTGFAAKSVLIDGAKIKNGSISGKKLSNTSIVPPGYSMLIVPNKKAKRASRSYYNNSVPQVQGTICSSGAIVYNQPCPSYTTETFPVPGPAGPVGAAGPDGKIGEIGPGPGATGSNRVTVPGAAGAVTFYAPTTGTVTASPAFAAAATATPSVATSIQDVQARIVSPSATNVPALITVILYLTNGTPFPTAQSCSFDPHVTDRCAIPGPIGVPANSAMAWGIVTVGKAGPPENSGWDTYDLSLGFRSLAG